MPVAEIHVLEGYSDREKERLGQAVTQAIRHVIPAAPEAVTVMISEIGAANYFRGGTRRTPAPALPDPADVVARFLDALGRRDVAAAEALMGPGFSMTFPGTAPMTRIGELTDWARDRYKSVSKTIEGIESFQGDDAAIVYVRGTLGGIWPDGSAFGGIRFIDRFEVASGLVTRQDVWNDIAEIRGKA